MALSTWILTLDSFLEAVTSPPGSCLRFFVMDGITSTAPRAPNISTSEASVNQKQTSFFYLVEQPTMQGQLLV